MAKCSAGTCRKITTKKKHCTQAVALLPLTQGVIIYKTLLVIVFLEEVHTPAMDLPGVHNKTISLLTCGSAK